MYIEKSNFNKLYQLYKDRKSIYNNSIYKKAESELYSIINFIYDSAHLSCKYIPNKPKSNDVVIVGHKVTNNSLFLEATSFPYHKSDMEYLIARYHFILYNNGEWEFTAKDETEKNKVKINSKQPSDIQVANLDNFSEKMAMNVNRKFNLGKSNMSQIRRNRLEGNYHSIGITFGKIRDYKAVAPVPLGRGIMGYVRKDGCIMGINFDRFAGWNEDKALDWLNKNQGKPIEENPYVPHGITKQTFKAEDLDDAPGGKCYHARLRNPDDFDLKRTFDFGTKEDGIKAVYARLKKQKGKWLFQAFMFDKDKWTKAKAASWLNKHKGEL